MSDNPQIDLARTLIETTDANVFLTGKAGTGKTTFLRRLRSDSPKRMAVLAPTGIAAINAGGMTIHSFFQLPFTPYVPGTEPARGDYKMSKAKLNVIRSIDLLVIDEISMVRADLLDAIDNALRTHRRSNLPFGGVQLLLIGDLQQLAPVVKDDDWKLIKDWYDTPFFFSSRALKETTYVTVELQRVYRQSDSGFLTLLNNIREGLADKATLDALNSRYVAGFTPRKEDGYIRLVTHNWQAQAVNQRELDQLPGTAYTYEAKVNGKFPDYSYPTDPTLTLKLGAQVMFVKNDASPEKLYYNGLIGEVTAISPKGFRVRPLSGDGKPIAVEPAQWDNTRYAIDKKTKEITEEVEGTFVQYPVKLAWAITIHKSQGLTFDRVMIDASHSFAHGQTYVALSRCKTLEGIVLTAPIPPSAVIADAHVAAFNADMRSHQPTDDQISLMQHAYSLHLLADLFCFDRERAAFAQVVRLIEVHLYRTYPRTLESYRQALRDFDLNVMGVASRFHQQYEQLLDAGGGDPSSEALQARIKAAAPYFEQQLQQAEGMATTNRLESDNAEVRARLKRAVTEMAQLLTQHRRVLAFVAREGFDTKSYLDCRAREALEEETKGSKATGRKTASAKRTAEAKQTYEVPEEVKHGVLYNRLKSWRTKKARESGSSPFIIMRNNAMICIANYLPANEQALLAVPSVGKKTVELYGKEILEMVNGYRQEYDEEADDTTIDVSNITGRKGEKPYETTLRLFREGMKPQEIARQRDLAPITVINHLARAVKAGQLNVDALMPSEHFARIEAYCKAHPLQPDDSLKGLRLALGEDISYDELAAALRILGLRD